MGSPPDRFISYQNPSCPAASSSRSFTQIGQKFSSIFNAKPTGPYRPLSFSMVHLIPKPNPTVCPIRSLTQIDHECSSIFNAKPTGADQPLRFKRYLLLRFIQKQLHPNPTQMFEQLQCQNHQTSSVIQIQQAHRTISSLYWQKLLLHTYCTSIQEPLRAKFHPGNGPREICFRQPCSHALMHASVATEEY